LLDGSEDVARTKHVSHLHALLEMERETGEEVSERVLERESDHDREHRRSGEHAGQADVEDQPEQERHRKPENEKGDDLPQQSGRLDLAAQLERDLEEDVVEQPGHDERHGDSDRQRSIVVVAARTRRRHVDRREEQDDSDDRRDERDRPDQAADEERQLVPDRTNAVERLHAAAILLATARGSAASWISRMPATPEIRSANGASSGIRDSSIPPMTKTSAPSGSRRGRRARTCGPSGGPKERFDGVSKTGPRTTRSAPSPIARDASAAEWVETPTRNPRGDAARTRETGRPSAGR
jgi:hypothetical protein